MPKNIHRVTTIVRSIAIDAGEIARIELADPDDWVLPPFEAGAHIDVHTASGKVRQYSLCGDPAEANRYRLAVKYEDSGRGGSRSLHRELAVGDTLLISLPRNHFPIRAGRRHILIAGGIGITPFMSMIPVFEREGADFELHYASRSRDQMPFHSELTPLVSKKRAHLHFSADHPGRLDMAALFEAAGADAQIYCCGPERMIAEAMPLASRLSRSLHIERFGQQNAEGSSEYTVDLVRSKKSVPVPPNTSMLAALREAGVDIPASCEAGVCLECKTRYLAGTPVHRDLTLPAADRNSFLTPCVSTCSTDRIALDL